MATTNSVKVHPMVLFGIMDQFSRRNDKVERVIGTLLGNEVNGVIVASEFYAVPHMEEDKKVSIDIDYNEAMLKLNKKVNQKLHVVGWYATGDDFTANDILIHNFYIKQCGTPVFLRVGSDPSKGQLPLAAFKSRSKPTEGEGDSPFVPMNVSITNSEAERVGINMLMKARDAQENGKPTTVKSDLQQLEDSVAKLLELVKKATKYTEDVLAGERESDSRVNAVLFDCVHNMPSIDKSFFQTSVSSSLQDQLMVVYLANLAKTQLQLAERNL
eukprot:GCRY01001035.1.p1 GENE.GCRY01001035.1~~GCRY01001035.1.p1  ORF type:complete len:306 (+),score=49.55 GCRY01001035.1:104-919(+)